MWKIISTKEIFRHSRITLLEDKVRFPDGTLGKYLKFKHSDNAATIICKRKDKKILLQKEYSHPIGKKIFQFPGGLVPLDEKPRQGANRELMEEASLKSNKLFLLGSYLINNRRTSSKMYVFLATDLIKKTLPKDKEEDIENFWFTESAIDKMIKNGKIINTHVLSSWALYKLKNNK
ncbi:MAG TPA: NUDIX hydrolase [Candidatus Moranbacteria bacterium]|nr:NUDIX hydrolase [Candidatus Moranbacteria bacterium]HRY28072.1 NUDIX hydrolase [Candidatus Moranbacteria bacterium]HSA08566.1 NUDIX hydrolase [Candidatus Moranbacteria bacterium]